MMKNIPDVDSEQLKFQIMHLPCFEGLEKEAIAALSACMSLRTFEPSEMLFWEGEPCAGLFIVKKGWLKAAKISLEGREQVIRFFKSGEMFNEVPFFSGGKNLVNVESLEQSQVWVIDETQFSRLAETYPSIYKIVLKNMALRVQHLLTKIEDLSFRSVEARLARALLENAQEKVATRRRWSTQAEMAAYMGTVPDVLHRVLKNLSDAKLIQVERTQIRILDEDKLREIAMVDD